MAARCSTARRATSPIARPTAPLGWLAGGGWSTGCLVNTATANRRPSRSSTTPASLTTSGSRAALGPQPRRVWKRPGDAGVAELLGHPPSAPRCRRRVPRPPRQIVASSAVSSRGVVRAATRASRVQQASSRPRTSGFFSDSSSSRLLTPTARDGLDDVGAVAGHHGAFQPQAAQGGVDPRQANPGDDHVGGGVVADRHHQIGQVLKRQLGIVLHHRQADGAGAAVGTNPVTPASSSTRWMPASTEPDMPTSSHWHRGHLACGATLSSHQARLRLPPKAARPKAGRTTPPRGASRPRFCADRPHEGALPAVIRRPGGEGVRQCHA